MVLGDHESRSALVLEIWGSFLIAIAIVATLFGVAGIFLDGAAFAGMIMAVAGFFVATPFLIVASVIAFFLTPPILARPLPWALAATLVTTAGTFWWMGREIALTALVIGLLASAVFRFRMVGRPIVPEGSAPP